MKVCKQCKEVISLEKDEHRLEDKLNTISVTSLKLSLCLACFHKNRNRKKITKSNRPKENNDKSSIINSFFKN